ncbi:MAG: hypothetical protein ACI4VN_07000 [Clostridia bacterium]
MELKKVTTQTNKNYAKKENITKKELKSATPNKWIVAASAGIVTLFYTSPKTSIYQIGVVFGCMEMNNYTPLYDTLDTAMNFFYYTTRIAGISFLLTLIVGIFIIRDDKKNKKVVKMVKCLLLITLILAIITEILVLILELDIPAFYVGGVKQ